MGGRYSGSPTLTVGFRNPLQERPMDDPSEGQGHRGQIRGEYRLRQLGQRDVPFQARGTVSSPHRTHGSLHRLERTDVTNPDRIC